MSSASATSTEATEGGRSQNELGRRLSLGFGGQIYSQSVQTLIRFSEVPVLLHFWGAHLYGEWLMLTAIPAYLVIGDGGFASAASRDMSIKSGAGDRAGALAVFQSTGWLLGLLSLVVFFAAVAVAQLAPLGAWLGFERMTGHQVSMVLLVLVAYVLVGFQGGLINGGFWCSGRYPLGMALQTTTQLVEFAAMIGTVALGGGPVQAALAYLAGRSVGTATTRLALRRAVPWLQYGLAEASVREVRRLTAPAFASLAFPLGNALNIQGMRLVLGLVLGPAAVAVFAPLRTLANLATQPRHVVNRLVEPELSSVFGGGDELLFTRLFLRSCQTTLWLCASVTIVLLLVGPWVWPIWTREVATLSWPLYLTLLAAGLVNSLWYTALMVPYATNRHGLLAIAYVGIYGAVALVIGYVAVRIAGLPSAGAGLLVAELAMTACVLPMALRMGRLNWRAWLSCIVRPPTFILSEVASTTLHALRRKL